MMMLMTKKNKKKLFEDGNVINECLVMAGEFVI
jgi:hypothetical protein